MIDSSVLAFVRKYLLARYELSVSVNDNNLMGIMIQKDNVFDHESVIVSIRDVFQVDISELLLEYDNILEQLKDNTFLEVWYEDGEFVVRIAHEVSEGPYGENRRKSTLSNLCVRDDTLIMAFRKLEEKIDLKKAGFDGGEICLKKINK